MTEKDLRNEIRDLLKAMGCFVITMHVGAIPITSGGSVRYVTNPNRGVPDLIGFLPDGRGFAIEVKLPKARHPRKHLERQRKWRDALRAVNVIAFQADDPKDVEMIISEAIKGGDEWYLSNGFSDS